MKRRDGYCVKTPDGQLWPAYFSIDKQAVENDMRYHIGGADGHNSLARLKREGYKVVPIIITEVREA